MIIVFRSSRDAIVVIYEINERDIHALQVLCVMYTVNRKIIDAKV